jgi:hypothetical protein
LPAFPADGHFNPLTGLAYLDQSNPDDVFAGIKSAVRRLYYDMINFFIARGPDFYADIYEIN